MTPSRILIALALFVSVTVGSATRASGSFKFQNEIRKAPEQSKQVAISDEPARLLNVLRVKAFAARALGFQDLKLKAITVARLADLLWTSDEPYARQLFIKALDFSAPRDDTSLKEAKLTARRLMRIRREVIGYISKRDANWAKRLIDSEAFARKRDVYSTSQINVETAYDLALSDQPESAVDFAERSLATGVSPWIVGVLLELRMRNEALANQLFLKVVQQAGSDPSVDPGTLLYLGTYIFTSPKVDPADPLATAQVAVGGVMVYDISADRPNIPPTLVRAFLQAAANLLTRGGIIPEQWNLYYVTDYIILAKAQRLAPDLAPSISAAMQALTTDVPRELHDARTYKTLLENASPPSLDESLTEIEKISGQDGRDERYLGLVASLWQKKECAKARLVASRIADAEVGSRLNSLIDFREAAIALASDIPKAEKIAQKMPLSIERAVLWLGIASMNFQKNRSQAAIDSLNTAVETARRIGDARRSFVLLNAAGQMIPLNSDVAILLFEEAVKDFNNQKAESLKDIVWTQKIEKGRAVRVFPLGIKGLNYGYRGAFLDLAKLDPEVAAMVASHFTGEDSSSESMVAVAAALLK